MIMHERHWLHIFYVTSMRKNFTGSEIRTHDISTLKFLLGPLRRVFCLPQSLPFPGLEVKTSFVIDLMSFSSLWEIMSR